MDARIETMRWVRRMLDEHPERIGGPDALHLVIDLCGRRARVHDASAYIFDYGRHLGYTLPAYPLAGCGQIKDLLADWGVRDLPSWYARIGIPQEIYDEIYNYDLLVVQDLRYQNHAMPIPIAWWERAAHDKHERARALELARWVLDYIFAEDHDPDLVLFD